MAGQKHVPGVLVHPVLGKLEGLGKLLLGYPVTSFFEDILVSQQPRYPQRMKTLGSLEV